MHGMTRGLLATDCEVAAARWVQRKLGDCRHERRVLAIAAKLLELTRPLLGPGLAESRLLRLSALLHDIGRCVSEKDHPLEGARLIAGTTVLALSAFDRRALAFLARYHRGSRLPDEPQEQFLAPHDARRPLHVILGLLRAADALDNRRLSPPQLILSMNGRRLNVQCAVHPGQYREAHDVFNRPKKFALLGQLLGESVQVRITRQSLALSA